ncbi:hypothetical protein GCM10025883_19170 [Mobilicoccus caccae]|uniref:Uncharacterized protein n=1 Tax=Mobilicoccus caccae TaxID=1859295 RepID=A0ABQ6IRT4_9MICO|nr:hypothetical protein GCM10025883_19170 [Mobilicoccus caccae]
MVELRLPSPHGFGMRMRLSTLPVPRLTHIAMVPPHGGSAPVCPRTAWTRLRHGVRWFRPFRLASLANGRGSAPVCPRNCPHGGSLPRVPPELPGRGFRRGVWWFRPFRLAPLANGRGYAAASGGSARSGSLRSRTDAPAPRKPARPGPGGHPAPDSAAVLLQ